MYCLLVIQCWCATVDHCTLCQMCQTILAIVMFGKWQATMIGSWSLRNSFLFFNVVLMNGITNVWDPGSGEPIRVMWCLYIYSTILQCLVLVYADIYIYIFRLIETSIGIHCIVLMMMMMMMVMMMIMMITMIIMMIIMMNTMKVNVMNMVIYSKLKSSGSQSGVSPPRLEAMKGLRWRNVLWSQPCLDAGKYSCRHIKKGLPRVNKNASDIRYLYTYVPSYYQQFPLAKSCVYLYHDTPLKFNSLPLKTGNPKRKLIFQP